MIIPVFSGSLSLDQSHPTQSSMHERTRLSLTFFLLVDVTKNYNQIVYRKISLIVPSSIHRRWFHSCNVNFVYKARTDKGQ